MIFVYYIDVSHTCLDCKLFFINHCSSILFLPYWNAHVYWLHGYSLHRFHTPRPQRLQTPANSTGFLCLMGQRWKVVINEQKSVYVDFALCTHGYFPMTIDGKDIPRRYLARYLGIFLEWKLNYKEHVKIKCNELSLQLQQLYWILGSHLPISLSNKFLIYQTICIETSLVLQVAAMRLYS